MRNCSKNLSLATGSLLVCLMIAELGTRYLGSYDADGNFTVFQKTLRPYRLPVAATKEKVASLSSPSTRVAYDPRLGWVPRPSSKSSNGFYKYNSLGIRSAPSEYSVRPQEGVLRIAIFGDSFTHGSEVPFDCTWGYYLEDGLKKSGLAAEVINFGVGGYGIDQAFLRWRELGHKFSPDLVIFGLQMENVKRNVNLIRPVYSARTDLPFSKPRFLLNGEGLALINNPPPPPGELPDVIKNINMWPLAKYEHFFNPQDYRKQAWHISKLFSLALDILSDAYKSFNRAELHYSDLSREPARLTLRILQEFRQSVEGYNKKFLIVYLPRHSDLKKLSVGRTLTYSRLLAEIEANNKVLHPEPDLLEEAKRSSSDTLFERQHYSARANELVANVIKKYILSGNGQNLLSSRDVSGASIDRPRRSGSP